MKLVYILGHPVRQRDAVRFGWDETRRTGTEVEVWDLTPWLSPSAHLGPDSSDRYRGPGLRRIASGAEADLALGTLDPAGTFCSLNLGLDIHSWRLYRGLARCRLRYSLTSTNAIPGSHQPIRLARIRHFTWSRLWGYLIRSLPPAALGLTPATIQFLGGRRSRGAHRGAYGRLIGPMTRRISVHTLDYEVFLRLRHTVAEPRHVVFLDEFLPFHWEYGARGLRSVDPALYFAQLNRLFQQVEDMSGLPVVVATHPSADYSKQPDWFQGRAMVSGSTGELVRDASLVIAHASTAVNFAVLFERPLLMVSSRAIQDLPSQRSATQALSACLERRVISLDVGATAAELTSASTPDPAAYRRYREDFIKQPGSPDLPLWKVTVDTARMLLYGR